MSIGLAILTLADIGWPPFVAFLDHLPGLIGGEAFPAFRNPTAMAVNFSVPGLAFKLKLLGVPGMGFRRRQDPRLDLYARSHRSDGARRTARREHAREAAVWLAILILATLRSPFLPQSYAPLPALWLLTLLAATYSPERANARTDAGRVGDAESLLAHGLAGRSQGAGRRLLRAASAHRRTRRARAAPPRGAYGASRVDGAIARASGYDELKVVNPHFPAGRCAGERISVTVLVCAPRFFSISESDERWQRGAADACAEQSSS